MCNQANCRHNDPLDDDLGDLMGGDPFAAVPISTEDAQAGIEIARDQQYRMHKETCRKCRGTGRFRGYSGMVLGECFACKGRGHNFYRQSLEERTKRAEQRAARQERAKAGKIEAFAEQHAAEVEWMVKASGRGFRFAGEMVSTIAKFGRLTEKQLAAVQRFMAEDQRRDAERAAKAAVAPVKALSVGAIMDALRGSGLKRAALRFADWTYSLAPESGANAGHIYVKAADGEYLGKIGPDGNFRTVRECSLETKEAVIAHIATMQTADEVREAAILSGKETGTCCCCGRELTNPESIEAGIGPVCATKWGF